MNYPTDIVNDDGWGRIHRGHGLSRHTLWVDLRDAVSQPPDTYMKVEEVHMRYVPRVKWCERLDGWACDNQGEWHSHWTAVRPGADTAFTMVGWESTRYLAAVGQEKP